MSDFTTNLYIEKKKPETFEELRCLYEKLECKKIQILADYKTIIGFSMQNLIDLFSVIKSAPDTNEKKGIEGFFTRCLGEEIYEFIEERVEEI